MPVVAKIAFSAFISGFVSFLIALIADDVEPKAAHVFWTITELCAIIVVDCGIAAIWIYL